MKFVLRSKQTKANLQKYFHPSSLNHLTQYCICACAMPRDKKGQQKVHIIDKLYPDPQCISSSQ